MQKRLTTGAWMTFTPESLEKDILQLVELPTRYSVCSQFPSFCNLSPMLWWVLVMQRSFLFPVNNSPSILLYVIPVKLTGSPSWGTFPRKFLSHGTQRTSTLVHGTFTLEFGSWVW